MVRVLNVAEKNDAAKSIAEIMSRGGFRRRDGRSVYNKIYEFSYNIFNQNCQMIMTSVSGHLLNLEFTGAYRSWQICNPVVLFEAPVVTECLPDYQGIKQTLEAEVRSCQYLIIWTDGDREGENIGFEIIEVCKKIKPNIKVYRARFSEITPQAISRACANLVPPDQRMSDAVNVRRELDLRIGAAFTRFQTLRLKKVFPDILANQLISYGSCQFPTLGFVVERYKQVQAFIPEAFWKLRVTHKREDVTTDFSWKRGRLFDHSACLALYQLCLEKPTAKVIDIKSRNKSKWRPQPLDTVEFEKLASRKLRINAKEAMTIAEKLYTKGFISYPRTETNIFPKELNLVSLVEQQREDPNWGAFAERVLQWGPNPRQGNKTDNAHPPIHPTKYINTLQAVKLDSALATYFNVTPDTVIEENTAPQLLPVMKCPKCLSGDIVVRVKKDNKGFFLSCMSYPNCNAVMWLPDSLEQISVTDEECSQCHPKSIKKVKLKFKAGTLMPFYPDEFVNCLGGCEPDLLEMMGSHPIIPSRNSNSNSSATSSSRNASSDSGYESTSHGSTRTNNHFSTGNSTLSRSQSLINSAFSRSDNHPSSGSSNPLRSQSVSNSAFMGFSTSDSRQTSSTQAPRNPFRPVPASNNRPASSNDDIVCNCGKKAIVLVVRKDGPTKGRQFYKCPEMSENTKCNFFLWKDEENSAETQNPFPQVQENFTSRFQPSSAQNENLENETLCRCNLPAKLMTVRKEGPTKGRPFYTCPKGRVEGCGFFKWGDADGSHMNASSSFESGGGFNHGSAASSNRRPANSDGGPPSKRKCGICSQPGHNRKKCPQNR
ncbi:DNA topoisomerase 3-alpha like protein [Argiope bruennichi]|uniref:DNA topoisomerase n=1 Tax=Argiope bruennichi TaxID=94029 RepID=A0A8T0EBT5_ARGBR|nr:DNA topoisomerase 3-alpha like protein [Argiope bruennichi]